MRTFTKALWAAAAAVFSLSANAQEAKDTISSAQGSEAQTVAQAQTVAEGKVTIKPVVILMPLFHTGLFGANDDRRFALDRSFVGVAGRLGRGWSFKAVLDFGNTKDAPNFNQFFYVRLAHFAWENKVFKISAGISQTNVVATAEAFWGRRYVAKAFVEEYGFGAPADLGINADIKATKWLAFDATITNGEGFQRINFNKGLLYGLGVSVTPVEGLIIRAYGDLNENENGGVAKKSLATLVGYKNNRFQIGVEWDFIFDANWNDANDASGVSAYASVSFPKRSSFFVRYDYVASKDGWNAAKDGWLGIVGVEVKFPKYARIAPNFRVRKLEANDKVLPYVYLSTLFSL